MDVASRRRHATRLRGRTRTIVAALELFVGVGALYGGYELLVDAERFGMETTWLEGTPFPDYTVPGLFLVVVIGGGMLLAAGLAVVGSRHAAPVAFWMGVTLLDFLVVETLVLGYQGPEQAALLASMGAAAAGLTAVGWRAATPLGRAPSTWETRQSVDRGR
jgi:hypothetical protein